VHAAADVFAATLRTRDAAARRAVAGPDKREAAAGTQASLLPGVAPAVLAGAVPKPLEARSSGGLSAAHGSSTRGVTSQAPPVPVAVIAPHGQITF